MSQDYYISRAGTGGAASMKQQAQLDAFISNLSSLERVDHDGRRYCFSHGWNTMSYTVRGLLISVGEARDEAFMRDFYRLVVFARGIDLNLFGDTGDPDDEFDWEFIVRLFEGHTGNGLLG